MNHPLSTTQDRQARNKPPPLAPATSSTSSTSTSKGKGKGPLSSSHSTTTTTTSIPQAAAPAPKSADEQFEERERRDQAARILGSREMLIWHAVANNEVCLLLCLSLLRFCCYDSVGDTNREKSSYDQKN